MRTWIGGLALVVLGLGTVPARAGGPPAVFGIIDRAELDEASRGAPRLKLVGLFTLLDKPESQVYRPAVYGVLYFSRAKGSADQCDKEWSALQKSAGTGRMVAFAHCFGAADVGPVRKLGGDLGAPSAFPTSDVTVLEPAANARGDAEQQLLSAPRPRAPLGETAQVAGKITLTVANILLPRTEAVKYRFEIEGDENAGREMSPAVAAGGKETSWKPDLTLKPGTSYTWRVHAVSGEWTGPTIEMRFRTEAAK